MKHRWNISEASVEHRQNIGGISTEHRSIDGIELNNTQQKIIELLLEDAQMTGVALAEKIGISKRNIENNVRMLKNSGLLVHHGSSKSGYWEVVKYKKTGE